MRNARFMITLAGAILLLIIAFSMSAMAEEETPPPGGDWIVMETKEFTGKTGYVEGSVFVMMNAQFTIEDSTLTINHSFIVNAHASLVIKNSTNKFDSNEYTNKF